MYGPQGAQFYHSLTQNQTGEIDDMLRVCDGRQDGGPALELACGSGRLTVPFLQAGHEMVCLDMSSHMLGILNKRLTESPDVDASRVTTIEGDMTNFALGRRFDLVLLAASAVLYLDDDQRAALFGRVREHLTDDGLFLMSLLEFPMLESSSAPVEYSSVFAVPAPVPMLCTFIDYLDPAERLRSTNFMCQRVQDGAVADTAIYTALSHLASADHIEEELAAAGLRCRSRRDVNSGFEDLWRKMNLGPDFMHMLLLEVVPG
ncbi:MAG TPA: daptide-type RiPP biosynthesis methyltransferase [Pseudonocardiaceae bacterium]|nr:daptide-type RiPP biosynthesis methyltransferase [Pseudonocardiaceae bacterium]